MNKLRAKESARRDTSKLPAHASPHRPTDLYALELEKPKNGSCRLRDVVAVDFEDG